MRILVVGAIHGGTVPIGKSICSAFAAIGQEARLLDFSTCLPQYLELRAKPDAARVQAFMVGLKKRLLDEVIQCEPDVILGIAQSPLNNAEVLAALRRAGIKLCYWFVEDHLVFDYWKGISQYFNPFFTIQTEPFFTELKAAGCERPYYLPTAFDDLAALGNPGSGPVIPLSFVGAPYPNRVQFFDKLAGQDFEIYGEGWGRHNNPSVRIGARRVTEAECWDIYQRSIINLNLHSSMRPDGFGVGDFVNPRTFEIAGLGGFQLTDMRQLLPDHFDTTREVPAFRSWEDMQAAIGYFLTHEDERKALAQCARQRVLKEHTYKHRAQEILSVLR